MIFKTFETEDGLMILKDCVFDDNEKKANLHIEIPEGITSIAACTFWGKRNIESVSLPSSLKNVYQRAFEKCTNLKSVTISEGVELIFSSAFQDCHSLKRINLPNSLTRLGSYAFASCPFEEIEIPESVKKIGNVAIHDTKIILHPESDITVKIQLDGCWGTPIYGKSVNNRLLNHFFENPSVENFRSMNKVSYKIPIALAYIDNDSYYLKYLNKYKKQAIEYCIENNDMNSLLNLTDRKIDVKKDIDYLIDYSICHENHEATIILMQYKNEIKEINRIAEFEL